jgi:hypothetical protein
MECRDGDMNFTPGVGVFAEPNYIRGGAGDTGRFHEFQYADRFRRGL